MRFTITSTTLLLSTFAGVANAHFRLLYPAPRGVFVSAKEPDFCGGYPDTTTNRTTFPLSGGFFSISTGHEGFTAGVLLAAKNNVSNWDDFNGANEKPQLVRNYAKADVAGTVCIPLNLNETGIEGVKDGANVTIQIVLDGDDGQLYQCADLTLSSSYKIPESQACVNDSSTAHGGSEPPSPSGSGSAPAPSSSGSGGNGAQAFGASVAFVAAMAGAVLFSL